MAEMQTTLNFKRGLTVKNRLVMAPMTTKMSFYDGVVTQDEIDYYALHSGEVGMVITGAANIQANGKGWEGELGVEADYQIPNLAKLAAAIKKNGTKAILQIFHAGRMTNRSVLRGELPVSASAVAAQRAGAETPRELSEIEIQQVIENFKQATLRAIKAGFDGVELHGANTYLLQQFFSPHSNRRTDQWGGDRQKRFRLIAEVVQAVTQAVAESSAENFIIGYRFSPEEIETPGIRFEDTLYLVDQLSELALDYLHVSLSQFDRIAQSPDYQEKPMIAYLQTKIAGRVPLIAVGNVQTKKEITTLLQTADLAAVGQSLLIDPHFVAKVFNDQEELIRRKLNRYDLDELKIGNGIMSFLEQMMPERII